ncbi:MAG: hypothetical protein NTV01_20085, partial [Bacteroidia bacterium]|nr:hypothetical protein [Bacteroidia bacterium]
SFNHKNYKKNGYATGIGAEIIDTSFLERLKIIHPELKNRQDFFEAIKTEQDSGVIDVDPELAAPEIDVSVRSIEKYHEISKIIQILTDTTPDITWSLDSIFQVYRNYHSLKTIVLVENVDGVNYAMQWIKRAGGIVQFVSLHPSSSYALERWNIPHKTKDDFYDANEVSQFGMDNFDRVHKLCRIIDRSFIDQFDIKTIRPGYDNFLNIKILFDVLFIHAKTLQKIIQFEKPDSLKVFAISDKEKIYFHPINNEESVYSEILKSDGWNIPIHINYYKEKINPKSSSHINFFQRIVSYLIQSLRSNALLINIGLTYKKRGLFTAIKIIFARIIHFSGHTVLIYDSGYNWDECLPNLYGAGISEVLRLNRTEIKKKAISNNKHDLSQEYSSNISKSIKKYYDNDLNLLSPVNLSNIISDRLSNFISDTIEECNSGYFFVQKYIRDNDIRCVLISAHPTALDNTVVRATRNLNIPVVSWQHGGAGYTYLPIMPHIEFAGSDLHLVFGEGVVRSYEDTCKKYGYVPCPPFRPVGSAALNRLLINNTRKTTEYYRKNRILFVTTSYMDNGLVVFTHLNQKSWDEHVWSIQKGILKLSLTFPDYEFTIKLHPSHISQQPLQMYKDDHDIQNVKFIVNEKSLSELIGESDIIIFDLISTGILESLTTTKDLFVYSGLTPIDEYPLNLLKKRAYVTDDLDDFTKQLNLYLLNGVKSDRIDNQNTEFLEKFGVYKLDNKCNNRASEEIRKIIQVSEKK